MGGVDGPALRDPFGGTEGSFRPISFPDPEIIVFSELLAKNRIIIINHDLFSYIYLRLFTYELSPKTWLTFLPIVKIVIFVLRFSTILQHIRS